MSFWVLHMPETSVEVRPPELLLPYDGVPDVTSANSQNELRRMLAAMHPNDPPERIARMAERYWSLVHRIQAEDILMVPLQTAQQVVFAESLGPVRYDGENARYTLHVRWLSREVAFHRFGRARALLSSSGTPLQEVTDAQDKNAIRALLALKGTRFARWKWIIFVVIAMKALYFILALLRKDGLM